MTNTTSSIYEIITHFLSSLTNFVLMFAHKIHSFGLISSNYGSLVAAFIVAILLFFFKEYIKPPPVLSGVYYIKSTTIKTTKNSYLNMNLYYTLILFSDGQLIEGTSEKTAERTMSDKEWIYPGKNRTRGVITGKVQRRYLRKHIIHLHISEKGSSRESSHYICLKYKKRETFEGTFFSSAADSSGVIICCSNQLDDYPEKSSPCRFKKS